MQIQVPQVGSSKLFIDIDTIFKMSRSVYTLVHLYTSTQDALLWGILLSQPKVCNTWQRVSCNDLLVLSTRDLSEMSLCFKIKLSTLEGHFKQCYYAFPFHFKGDALTFLI